MADLHKFWVAMLVGRILPLELIGEMVRPRSSDPDRAKRYGLGFWLDGSGNAVSLEGFDAGVAFHSAHNPDSGLTYSVISNWTDGAWPVNKVLSSALGL